MRTLLNYSLEDKKIQLLGSCGCKESELDRGGESDNMNFSPWSVNQGFTHKAWQGLISKEQKGLPIALSISFGMQ